MSRDDARAHIRAAQEAEIAGNKEGAVRHLERAALAYVRLGQHARAAQMYRNCLRLAPDRADLRDALSKAERWAEDGGGPERAVDEGQPAIVGAEGFDALAIPRGPTRMPEGLEAWCSFCCRPTREVGELVAGPAGAFICSGCIRAGQSLLGHALAPAQTVAPSLPRPVAAETARGPASWIGPAPILRACRAALVGRGPSIVVIGPEGAGKSALLEMLAADPNGGERVDLARGEPVPPMGTLLVDHLESASAAQRATLRGRAFVATWRGEPKVNPLAVKLGDEVISFPAADFDLPADLGPVAALALPTPDADQLRAILERALAEVGPALAPELQEALVARALASGRGGKALFADLGLLRSLPAGAALSWAGNKPKARRKRS